jgi:farnesyl-diphosphate farnesyltransferase
LEKFDKLINAFLQLKPVYQDVISDICKRMGDGMAYFLDHNVDTIEDWELYCHYVAGLVGYGLSSLFGASGIESSRYGSKELEPLSNSMGLFLQKTNIIRDYLEDVSEVPPRLFWPKSVWSKYAANVQDLALYENKGRALACLNELITDAMKHSIDCLDYLKDLKDPSVFAFCAIPQVMAISTLSLCYNNHDVFLYEVKIAKGEAVRLILAAKNYNSVVACFQPYARALLNRIPASDPSSELLKLRVNDLLKRCEADLKA